MINNDLFRYGKLIPQFVRGVYEGLMQDPPSELLSPSERSDLEESPMRSAKQPSVAAQNSHEARFKLNFVKLCCSIDLPTDCFCCSN